jgi:hypothetical protein
MVTAALASSLPTLVKTHDTVISLNDLPSHLTLKGRAISANAGSDNRDAPATFASKRKRHIRIYAAFVANEQNLSSARTPDLTHSQEACSQRKHRQSRRFRNCRS